MNKKIGFRRKSYGLMCMVLCIVLSASINTWGQNGLQQSIRGKICDASSGEPIPYVTVILADNAKIGALTDSIGQFALHNVPVGRHAVKASCIGYEPIVMKELLVTSAKETYLDIAMKESLTKLDEVVVRPRVNKELPLNKMTTSGARMFSVEEASRYAGGFDDPARLASSFSGVSSDGATNGISIHGNAPHLLLWRLEDVEIPNPNHFADISVLGGGIFSSLSAMVLGNSDFMTGAFPAEYGNAVSGVFDMKLRNGNDQKYEHTAQIGVAGIDIASEGPINKKTGASYIANYRYSMTGIINKIGLMDMQGQDMNYQDLNFKLNFPTRKSGTFTLWGTGLIDRFTSDKADKNPSEWKYNSDKTNSSSNQVMGAFGLSHKYFFRNRGQLKTTLAGTFFNEDAYIDSYNSNKQLFPNLNMHRKSTDLTIDISYNRKYSAGFTNKTGIVYTHKFYNMNMSKSPYYEYPMQEVYDGSGNSGVLRAYTTNAWNISNAITFNFGLNAEWMKLNDAWSVEPRAGIKWQTSEYSSFAAAYGLHSRAEKTDVYYVKNNGEYVNKSLGFTKAHHFMLTYAWKISENTNLKVEPYYQYLFNVPVEDGTSYSVLNRTEFYIDKTLTNSGKGKNYGIDITLEKYMNRGWYAMLSGTLFNSRYCGGDGVWHDSRYNRKFIVNAMGGKEWMVGSRRQNMLSVNVKATFQGGDRYSPIDEKATLAAPDHEVQYDESQAFSQSHSPMLIFHYTISYKINRKRVAHEFSIKHINATSTKSYTGYEYNYTTGKVDATEFTFAMPNVSYKLEF